MQNTPGATEPGVQPEAAPGPPQATKRTTVTLTVALVLVVVMTGVLGTVAVLMTRNQDAPPLTTTSLKRLATPIHFAPVVGVGTAPCASPEAVPDDAGAKCYQLAAGVTVAVVQKIESVAETDGTFGVRVVLAPASREPIADLTQEVVNQQLAIVVGDKVVAAPRVAQEITQDSLLIAGFTKPEADALLARLNGTGATTGDQAPPAVTPPADTPPADTSGGQPIVPDPASQQPQQQPGTGTPPTGQQQSQGVSQPAGGSGPIKYASCAEAIAAGQGPYFKGVHQEYNWYVDRDNDGVACDRDEL